MSQKYEKLKTLLKELFQLDQPDLDFGLYRIMHSKSAEVTQFLDKDLLPQVKEAFALYKTADKVEVEKELAKVTAGIEAAGMDPEQSPKVKELRARLETDVVDVAALESEVYDHLFSFFRRYYSEGDFLAKRVYKAGTYAIPYEGEEVKLYWANQDQYYIKSSEYLRDYAFRLRPEDEQKPMRVHFRLADAAEGEHGNIKAAEGKERRFRLAGDRAVSIEGGELVIRFTYQPDPSKQKDLNAAAEAAILAVGDSAAAAWIAELKKPHVRADGATGDSSRLRVHLDRYTARNTFDYFIHKDLGGFLRRELDFYIKNEVMHLDDVENETAPRVEQYLSKIKVIRKIAGKIIDFLAQLEDFQKKLWLKKKFVVETSWCIALGVVPEEFYAEIAANDAQREEWVKLCAIDEIRAGTTTVGYSKPLKPAFLKGQPTLMVDTRHFSHSLVERLLAAIEDVGSTTDVELVHGENLQAVAAMRPRSQGRLRCVYIDPPYNTAASEIMYKNDYKHSSWLSLICDRVMASRALLTRDGVFEVAIDDAELGRLGLLLDNEFGESRRLATISVRSNPHGRAMASGVSVNHEYVLVYGNGDESSVGRLPRDDVQMTRYPESDSRGAFTWINFRKTGADSQKADRPKSFYPVYVGADGRCRIPRLEWSSDTGAWAALDGPIAGEEAVLPVDSAGAERVWTTGSERARREAADELEARKQDGIWQIYRKYRPNDEGALPGTWWAHAKYSATESGTKVLNDLFGARALFSFPKSVLLVEDCLRVAGLAPGEAVLDFFAGSGTTAHAVINLNRADGGRRTVTLVEVGIHFDQVLLPRIKKVAFSPEWKDGKPARSASQVEMERSPRIIKVVRLESYEDALNNLETRRTGMQQRTLGEPKAQGGDSLREQYVLRYMLGVETRGSQSLLNVQAFADPTAYKLKVKRPGSDESRETNVDLQETFNWLIGLTVRHMAAPKTFAVAFERDGEGRLQLKGRLKEDPAGPYWFRAITGTVPDGRKALIVWRKLTGQPEQDNLVLDAWFTKQGYSSQDSEFGLIYVNGGNNLENLRATDQTWKVRLIEEDFHRLMFASEAV